MELLIALAIVGLIMLLATASVADKSMIAVDPHGGWSGAEIERLLKSGGIGISHRNPGGMGGPPDLFFFVDDGDYSAALDLLKDAGVPVKYGG